MKIKATAITVVNSENGTAYNAWTPEDNHVEITFADGKTLVISTHVDAHLVIETRGSDGELWCFNPRDNMLIVSDRGKPKPPPVRRKVPPSRKVPT